MEDYSFMLWVAANAVIYIGIVIVVRKRVGVWDKANTQRANMKPRSFK